MKRHAVVHIELSSKRLVEVLLKSILPETRKPSTSRSTVSVEGRDRRFTIRAEAEDTSALRAALNSYLRWVILVKDTYDVATRLGVQAKCENT